MGDLDGIGLEILKFELSLVHVTLRFRCRIFSPCLIASSQNSYLHVLHHLYHGMIYEELFDFNVVSASEEGLTHSTQFEVSPGEDQRGYSQNMQSSWSLKLSLVQEELGTVAFK